MKVSDLAAASVEVLWHPLVLKGAWMRVEDWYRSGNLAPEPELSRWRLHPEAELRKLGADLREGTWPPSRWPQVPYPKKGACLRHYVLPTVRDQVAFMAYLVVLGPLLDSRVANFVFGNREDLVYMLDGRPMQRVPLGHTTPVLAEWSECVQQARNMKPLAAY